MSWTCVVKLKKAKLTVLFKQIPLPHPPSPPFPSPLPRPRETKQNNRKHYASEELKLRLFSSQEAAEKCKTWLWPSPASDPPSGGCSRSPCPRLHAQLHWWDSAAPAWGAPLEVQGELVLVPGWGNPCCAPEHPWGCFPWALHWGGPGDRQGGDEGPWRPCSSPCSCHASP